MPQTKQTILICSASGGAMARQLVEALEPFFPKTRLDAAGLDALEGDIRAVSALVLHLEEADGEIDRRRWRSAVDRCDEASVPVLALMAEDRAWAPQSALRTPADAPPREIAARLEALLHQQATIGRLKSELQIVQRFQSGLRGEITRMHDELQLAAMVQQEILPRTLPTLFGIRFGVLWRPTNYVSGDIYDVIRLDEEHIGVFLADVVGHGVPAALLTMVVSRALRTKEIKANSYRLVPPGEALSILNQEMIRRQGDTTRFATAVYGVIDCRSRTMRIAGAGHPSPILFREGQPTVELATPGGLLGVFDDEEYPEIEIELALNDRLLLFSDGFEVAFPEPDCEGATGHKMPTKRWVQELERLGTLSGGPDVMIAELSRRLDAQPGSLHQTDDLTLIAIEAGSLVDRESSATPAHRSIQTPSEASPAVQ